MGATVRELRRGNEKKKRKRKKEEEEKCRACRRGVCSEVGAAVGGRRWGDERRKNEGGRC